VISDQPCLGGFCVKLRIGLSFQNWVASVLDILQQDKSVCLLLIEDIFHFSCVVMVVQHNYQT